MLDARGYVFLQPLADLLTESRLFRRIDDGEIHARSSFGLCHKRNDNKRRPAVRLCNCYRRSAQVIEG